MKGNIGRVLERVLELLGHTTTREQALALEFTHVKEQLSAATTRADMFTAVAEERLALIEAASALADERAALLAAAATRAENAEKQLGLERSERGLAANRVVRLELRVQALKRRRERLQADLCKLQDQFAHADVSGRIRELQEEKARLQQRLADLQTYFEEKQGSANPH